MIGMITPIMNYLLSVIRKVQHQASTMCCVEAVGTVLRGVVVSRAVTSVILTTATTAAVCAYPSQFYNDKNFICCTWRDIWRDAWRDTWRDGTNRTVVVYMLADGE